MRFCFFLYPFRDVRLKCSVLYYQGETLARTNFDIKWPGFVMPVSLSDFLASWSSLLKLLKLDQVSYCGVKL